MYHHSSDGTRLHKILQKTSYQLRIKKFKRQFVYKLTNLAFHFQID